MSCCHYDEGYDDGLAEGRDEKAADALHDFLEALVLAYDARLDFDKAALLREVAVETAGWNLKRLLEIHEERALTLALAYNESRAA